MAARRVLSVCLLACILASIIETAGASVQLHTSQGSLLGVTRDVDDGRTVSVDIFYSIPYAKPPVGDLRFSKPVASVPWTGVRNASEPGPMCPQPNVLFPGLNQTYFGQEDCLYLNVYAPRTHGPMLGHPVMVFIHGGAFFLGSGSMFDGAELAARSVVVVTINYRIGVLGFLSTQDDVSPGNYGLHDQVMALRWVRDNIQSFGGNPHDVTIFGESAGAACTSLLVASDSAETRGLFHQAIQESGSSLSPWAVGLPTARPQPLNMTTTLASRLGCPVDDHARLLTCMKTKDVRTIVGTHFALEQENGQRLTMRPAVEGSFGQSGLFSDTPENLLKAGLFNNVTVIRGFNKNEGAYGMETLDPRDEGISLEKFTSLTRDYVSRAVLSAYPHLDLQNVMDHVINTYVTQPAITDPRKLRDVYIQIITDFDYFAPTYKEMLLFDRANGQAEYQYYFTFRSNNKLAPGYMGVPHTDELFYVFGYPLTNLTLIANFVSSWSDDDIAMTKRVMTWWTDFAIRDNPTPRGSVGPDWLPWKQDMPQYLDINRQPAMTAAPQSPGMHLWNDVISTLTGGPLVG